jgi:hypothetical protein
MPGSDTRPTAGFGKADSAGRFRIRTFGGQAHRVHSTGEDHPCKRNHVTRTEPRFDADHCLAHKCQRQDTAHSDGQQCVAVDPARLFRQRPDRDPARRKQHHAKDSHDYRRFACLEDVDQHITDQQKLSQHASRRVERRPGPGRPAPHEQQYEDRRNRCQGQSLPGNRLHRVVHC